MFLFYVFIFNPFRGSNLTLLDSGFIFWFATPGFSLPLPPPKNKKIQRRRCIYVCFIYTVYFYIIYFYCWVSFIVIVVCFLQFISRSSVFPVTQGHSPKTFPLSAFTPQHYSTRSHLFSVVILHRCLQSSPQPLFLYSPSVFISLQAVIV